MKNDTSKHFLIKKIDLTSTFLGESRLITFEHAKEIYKQIEEFENKKTRYKKAVFCLFNCDNIDPEALFLLEDKILKLRRKKILTISFEEHMGGYVWYFFNLFQYKGGSLDSKNSIGPMREKLECGVSVSMFSPFDEMKNSVSEEIVTVYEPTIRKHRSELNRRHKRSIKRGDIKEENLASLKVLSEKDNEFPLTDSINLEIISAAYVNPTQMLDSVLGGPENYKFDPYVEIVATAS